MRRGVAIGLALFLIGVWAAVPGRSAPAYGPQQTVVIAEDISSVVSLDPQVGYEFLIPVHNVYSNLVQFPTGNLTQVRPQLAQSYEVSKDARTYTFHLRHGV